jgi:hypothetical protein
VLAQEVLATANEAKQRGNEQFKLGKWAWACDHYTEAIDVRRHEDAAATTAAAGPCVLPRCVRACVRVRARAREVTVVACNAVLVAAGLGARSRNRVDRGSPRHLLQQPGAEQIENGRAAHHAASCRHHPHRSVPTVGRWRVVCVPTQRQELYEQAAADCTESLKLAPDNIKTLLRRAKVCAPAACSAAGSGQRACYCPAGMHARGNGATHAQCGGGGGGVAVADDDGLCRPWRRQISCSMRWRVRVPYAS